MHMVAKYPNTSLLFNLYKCGTLEKVGFEQMIPTIEHL